MAMPKHVISFTRPQYEHLNKAAAKLGLSVSELVRRAVDDYRMTKDLKKKPRVSDREFDRLLQETSAIWKGETEGLTYQKNLRRQWRKRPSWRL